MALADDTRRMVAIPTRLDEIPVGAEVEVPGEPYLVPVIDTDGAFTITLSFERIDGANATYSDRRDTRLNVWERVPEAKAVAA